jgi:hypothetical protein
MMKLNLSKAGAAFLLLSLAAACGSSAVVSSDGGNPTDTGSETEGTQDAGVEATDSGNLPETEGTPDGGGGPESGGAADGGGTPESGGAADSGGAPDGEDAADAGDGALPLAVNLGTAGDYVILAMSGISTVPTSAVTGNLGVSPASATAITGFSLKMDATNVFATSRQVVGKVYAAGFAVPTPSNLTTAISDMHTAFTLAAGRAPGVTELGAGNIGGKTLTPGVYKWSTGLLIPTDITLAGSATDVWIFQIAQTLTVSSTVKVSMTGGAVPKNVFWQVSGLVDLGTTSHFEGVILGKTSIALKTGASIDGRLMAQTAVTLDDSAVVEPAQ